MSKISSLASLAGANVEVDTDVLPIVDMSETGNARNKKITPAEMKIALGLGALADEDTIGNEDWAGSPLEIENGGTGAATAEDARGQLDVYSKAEVEDLIVDGDGIPLDSLADVDAPAPDDGDVLTWQDGSPGAWVPLPAPGGGGSYTDADARAAVPFTIGFPCYPPLGDDEIVAPYVFTEAVTFPADFAGAAGVPLATPTALTTYTVMKIDGGDDLGDAYAVGTVEFDTDDSFAFETGGSAPVAFAAGDAVFVQGQASADATAACSFTLKGVRA